MLTEISELDTSIFIFLNNLGSSTWDKFWLVVTEKKNHIPLIILLLFLVYKTLGLKRFIISVLVVAAMGAFTDQITNLAKYSFMRPRPCKELFLEDKIRLVAHYCSKYGFFSGHSSNSMAIAIMIGLLLKTKYPKAIYLLIVWALFMGYSRIYIGVHYPGDVITGFTFGVISGYSFYRIFIYISSKWFKESYESN